MSADELARWTGFAWLDNLSKEAGKSMHTVLFWSTIALMLGTVVSMAVYR